MYYDLFDTGHIGTLTLVGDEDGLRHIEFEKKKRKLTIQPEWKKYAKFFAPVRSQLRAYFKRELKAFDLPLAPVGTQFQLKVWQALRDIPYGEGGSYKTIAEAIGNPNAVRAVGGANGRNPIPIIVPCHRVIGSNGTLTGFGGGLETKQRLIELERPQRQIPLLDGVVSP